MFRRIGLVILPLPMLWLVACQHDPYAHTYTRHRPAVDEIAGVYEWSRISMRADAPAIQEKIRMREALPRITVFSDGRVSAVGLPVFLEVEGDFGNDRFEGFQDFEGRWEIASVGGIGDGVGRIEDHYGLDLDGFPKAMRSAGFTGRKKVDGLIFGFGDPDSGEAVFFSKKSGPAGE